MRVHNDEGVANHMGPEPCVDSNPTGTDTQCQPCETTQTIRWSGRWEPAAFRSTAARRRIQS